MLFRRFFSSGTAAATTSNKRGRKSFKLMDKRPIVVEQRTRNNELNTQAETQKLDWRIISST
jgi:hypothetical protein